MERAICLAIGYLFGLFQTGYLYSKAHHMDIRNYGSGNSGSTNEIGRASWRERVWLKV